MDAVQRAANLEEQQVGQFWPGWLFARREKRLSMRVPASYKLRLRCNDSTM
jgi:hypothetical protein